MSHAVTLLPDPFAILPISAAAALWEVTAFADSIVQTLRVSRALLLSGRQVSLDGLETQIAQLCARCLGLDPRDGTILRLHLLALRAELDSTAAILAARHEPTPCRCTTS